MALNAPEPVDEALRALADPVRRRTVELLADRPHRSGELADALAVAPSVMSKHLRVLRQGGLVAERPDGLDARVRVYSLRSAGMADLRSWMDRAERGWVEQLTALRDHLEGSEGATESGDVRTRDGLRD
ncbi:MAG: metalloregulator ArsR/SmtB family transcription factor [Microthrixaceae bacterium]